MPHHESNTKEAALEWLGRLGYALGYGPQMAPSEVAADRASAGGLITFNLIAFKIFCKLKN
jgi:hypothetical protein